MSAESRKDEFAARALSRLPDPPLPEGLAARIAARATATPQIGAVEAERVPAAASRPIDAALARRSERRSPLRWRVYAAASVAAAALLSVGILAGMGNRQDAQPSLAKEEGVSPLPGSKVDAPAKLADAVPGETAPAKQSKKALQSAVPVMRLPVPATEVPVELASEDKPAEPVTPAGPVADQKELAQTGPQTAPPAGIISAPVYGPPAPSGFGIAGPVNAPTSIPGETANGSRAPRGPSSGPPPGGLPGPSTPRGPGSRH